MRKLAVYIGFVALATLAAGLFGMLHNQISYSVSPEYYTRFKFIQFHLLDASAPERLRAAQVGWLATWWTGLPLGLLAGWPAFFYRDARSMAVHLLRSLPVALGVVLLCALAGLVYGCWQTRHGVDLLLEAGWWVPQDVTDLRRFFCAGYMHNAAYLGGALAVPLLWVWHWQHTRAQRR